MGCAGERGLGSATPPQEGAKFSEIHGYLYQTSLRAASLFSTNYCNHPHPIYLGFEKENRKCAYDLAQQLFETFSRRFTLSLSAGLLRRPQSLPIRFRLTWISNSLSAFDFFLVSLPTRIMRVAHSSWRNDAWCTAHYYTQLETSNVYSELISKNVEERCTLQYSRNLSMYILGSVMKS